eukprot:403365663
MTLSCKKKIKKESSDSVRKVIPNINNSGHLYLKQKRQFPKNKVSSTKYNLLTFLPVSLFIQFLRVTNVFYLINAILQSIPDISTNSPLSTIIPLAFVVILGMIRELIADVKRWNQDRKTNNRLYAKVQEQNDCISTILIKSQDLRVGDIIYLQDDQQVPADCLLLATNQTKFQGNQSVHSEDVPSHMKTDNSPRVESSSGINKSNRKVQPESQIELNRFEKNDRDATSSNLEIHEESKQNMSDQKIRKNKLNPISQKSKQFLDVPFKVVTKANLGNQEPLFQQCFVQTSSLDGEKNLKPKIPIKFIQDNIDGIISNQQQSLITIECEQPNRNLYQFRGILKYETQEKEQSFDLDLKQFIHSGSTMKNTGKVLALVLYTGKQTKILMNQGKYHYKQSVLERQLNIILIVNLAIILSVAAIMSGRLYKFIEDNGRKMKYVFPEENPDSKYWALNAVGSFYILMNSLIPLSMVITLEISKVYYTKFFEYDTEMISITDDNQIQGCRVQSLTLHEELGNINYLLCDKTGTLTQNELIFKQFATSGCTFDIEQDELNDFSYQRDEYILFIKGADGSIIPRLERCSKVDKETLKSLEQFSEKGYRTLVFAQRKLNYEQVEQILNGQMNVEEIESSLTLLGVTGVEDLLQENVQECINDFQDADIKVWMLTGDKGETAHQIGFSCGIFRLDYEVIRINEQDDINLQISSILNNNQQSLTQKGLLISGTSIQLSFTDLAVQDKLLELLQLSKSVIIYRCSPAQKAEIVKFVKNKIQGSVTLAIGDGANDVNMIQQAHVGIGIFGKEGNQAAQFSDYAIPKFKDLRRLMFWHGRTYGVKLSNFVKWFVYKNSIYSITLLYFNIENGFSGTSIMSDLFYALYDISMTTIAILIYNIFEQDVDFRKKNCEDTIGFKLSSYYSHCRDRILSTTIKQYFIWLLYVFISSVPFYMISQYAYQYAVTNDGKTEGLWASGFVSAQDSGLL